MEFYVIKFIYKHKKSWNCERVCETREEFERRVSHELEYGNKIVYTKQGCNCYIDY